MSCDQYIELISAALDGELTADERRELDRHLAGCPSCDALFEELSANSRAMRDLDVPFPADLHDRILNNLPTQDAPAKKGKVIAWKRWIPVAAAACLVLVVSLLPGGKPAMDSAPGAPDMASNGAPAPVVDAPAGDSAKAEAAEYDDSLSTQNESQKDADARVDIPFTKVTYLRSGYDGTSASASATVISNITSLDSYLADSSISRSALDTLRETYQADFFSNRSLLMVALEEGSGSISHELQSVSTDAVTIRRIVPEAGTCDMVAWLLVVELDELLNDGSNLNVVFTE